jgi:4,5-dihydroxyphthalate decarboxylase
MLSVIENIIHKQDVGGDPVSKLRFTFACSPYDRMQPLLNGTVVPEGIDLNFIPIEIEENAWRQLKHQEFDGSETSLSSYTQFRSRGDDRFIAIPVFTSRFFRHSCVYINTHKGIKGPQDLKGKTVGVPEYPMTAAVWLRGIFQHEYGVRPGDMRWRSGGEEIAGRQEKLKLDLPGVEKNRKTLDTLCQYSFEQSLSVRKMSIEELFAPETFDEFNI